MSKTIRTAIKSLNSKAQLKQGQNSLAKLKEVIETLPLFSLFLLLIGLLGTISPKIKSEMLLPLSDTTASIRLLNVNGYKNTQSNLAFHQEAKQKVRPFDLEKQVKARAGIDAGGIAPEAKLHS